VREVFEDLTNQKAFFWVLGKSSSFETAGKKIWEKSYP